MCNVLVVADQLLIPRLKEMCEVAVTENRESAFLILSPALTSHDNSYSAASPLLNSPLGKFSTGPFPLFLFLRKGVNNISPNKFFLFADYQPCSMLTGLNNRTFARLQVRVALILWP